MTTMNDNYIITPDGELYHHGVKGMKWGVRKADRYNRISKASKRASDMYKGMADDAKTDGSKYLTRKYSNTAKLYERRADKYAKKAENLMNKPVSTVSRGEKVRRGVTTVAAVGSVAVSVATAAAFVSAGRAAISLAAHAMGTEAPWE